jgi:hypothetical protein
MKQEDHPEGSHMWLTKQKWHFKERAVLIVDKAQGSYWDKRFWNNIKAIQPDSPYRIITFASYGSAGCDYMDDTSCIPPHNTVSLRPTNIDGEASVRLLLSKSELNDFVAIRFIDHCFNTSLLNAIFNFTNGHVGACEDFLSLIGVHHVSLLP